MLMLIIRKNLDSKDSKINFRDKVRNELNNNIVASGANNSNDNDLIKIKNYGEKFRDNNKINSENIIDITKNNSPITNNKSAIKSDDDINNNNNSASIRRLFKNERKEKIEKIENNLNSLNIRKSNEEFDKIKFQRKLEKFKAKKNNLKLNFFGSLKNFFSCASKKSANKALSIYDILDEYSRKIYKKFDIFHYLKSLKNLKHLKKYLLDIEQRHIIDVLSQKNYSLKISDFSKKKKHKTAESKTLSEEKKLKLYTDKVISVAKAKRDEKFLKLIFRENEDF